MENKTDTTKGKLTYWERLEHTFYMGLLAFIILFSLYLLFSKANFLDKVIEIMKN